MNADSARITRVLAALDRLDALDPTPWSQGLSPEGARLAWRCARDAITAAGLARELATPGERPRAVIVLVAAGVFTSPLEWVALLAAAGIAVLLKPPAREPAFCEALAAALRAEDLPVTLFAGHALPAEGEVVLAFGSDSTMAALEAAWPGRRLVLHGHRFSAALVADGAELDRKAAAFARDLALYDTRGCMAPVALFTTADPDALAPALAAALAEAEARWPAGPASAAAAPRLRERAGLARVIGKEIAGDRWRVLQLPLARFHPEALPRVAVVHAAPSLEAVADALAPYRAHLSTLGADLVSREGEDPRGPAWLGWFPRVCPLGAMQAPPFPRRHDGRPMLGSILGWG